ncbi:MAG TPA: hypothetical protein VNO84_05860 [Burkholderiaceae bacterium]|nr:hypothetical protein [Burkholderiaceae bacterium]
MNGPRPVPPRQVPTLTEVIAPPAAEPPPVSEPAGPGPRADPLPAPASPGGAGAAVAPTAGAAAVSRTASEPRAHQEEQITERVLADLQRQIDMMLEYRLREMLTPALARVADQLIRETRAELAGTLRDVVARAVAQELARLRGR